jgi:non-haem Fe2+, alpha-ketoglutarate-dependent halogenase
VPILPAEPIARYGRDGVLFPIRVLDDEHVRAYRSACDSVLAALGPDRPRNHLSQWHLCFRWAYELALETAVLDAVESVIGPNILVHSSTMFVKPPDGRSFVPWHQDGHYWRMDAPRLTSAWIALSPSIRVTGCLRVIAGSHQGERVVHRERADEDSLLSGL